MTAGDSGRRIIVCENPAEVASAAAQRLVVLSREAIEERGRMRLALAGGRTPETLYRLLAESPYQEAVAWPLIEVFWGDERCVWPDHPESNYRMAREVLLSKVPIPAANVHRMRGEFPDPDAAAREYEAVLRRVIETGGNGPPRFDLCLLGLGPDGHTASLFPGSAAVRETTRWATAAWVAKFSAYRLTLTPPLLNGARYVLFLVTGADKAEAVREVLEGPEDPDRFPAQIVQPASGRVEWLLDRDAARSLASVKG